MSSAVATKGEKTIFVVRGILKELRNSIKQTRPNETLAYRYIVDVARRHQVTDRRVCRQEAQLLHLASTYHCYLNSTRKHKELYEHYYGKGERSVEEAASIVGLALPPRRNDQ